MLKYEVIIIGGGSAGLTLASRYNKTTTKCLLVNDNSQLGGDCLHYGCMPSKALIHKAKQKSSFSEAMAYVRSKQQYISSYENPDAWPNIDFVFGEAHFISNYIIEVNSQTYQAEKIIIATGSSPKIVNIPGLVDIDYLTNESFFKQDDDFESMIVIGGGVIGIELGCALCELGKKVTIIEANPTILAMVDNEVLPYVKTELSKKMTIIKNIKIVRVWADKQLKYVEYIENDQSVIISANRILLAVGRQPNIKNLRLENTDIKVNIGIVVNEYLQTSVENIYALGDVINNAMFSHAAYIEGKTVYYNINNIVPKALDLKTLGYIVFMTKEIFGLGLTQKHCEEQGIVHQVLTFKSEKNDRHIVDDEFNEFYKIIVDNQGLIIGAFAFAEGCGDYLQILILMMQEKISIIKLTDMIFPYPSRVEVLQKLVKQFVTCQ